MALFSRPWPFAAGIATAVAGAVLIALAPWVPPPVSGSAVALGAILELAAGAAFTRGGRPGMAHVFAGVFAVSLAFFIIGSAVFDHQIIGAAPIAGILGVFCFINGLFRGLDVVIDRPRDLLPECIDAAFTFVIGATLLLAWRTATPGVVSVAAGLELLVGGAVLAAGALDSKLIDGPAYDGRADTLDRLGQQVPNEIWPNEYEDTKEPPR